MSFHPILLPQHVLYFESERKKETRIRIKIHKLYRCFNRDFSIFFDMTTFKISLTLLLTNSSNVSIPTSPSKINCDVTSSSLSQFGTLVSPINSKNNKVVWAKTPFIYFRSDRDRFKQKCKP